MKWIKIFMMLVLIMGLSLVIIYSNWQTALGVFLLTWFNNWELGSKFIKR